ncbi:MAG: hypothetical protein PHD66_04950 [Eubacteriales bacterium]|nr:hypothetical protein [Eubacteriales bacterium]
MKKILAILVTALLIGTISALFTSAEESTAEIKIDGYEFNINYVNGVIKGEDAVIITNKEEAQTANLKFVTYFICKKVSDNVYKVTANAVAGCEDPSKLSIGEDEILIAIHSDSSPNAKNKEQKKAAALVKKDMSVTLSGIDLAGEKVTDGKAVLSVDEPILDTSSGDESSKAESSEPSKSGDDSNAEVSKPTNSAADSEDVESSAPSKSSEITTSDSGKDGLDKTTIILIAIAAVVVIGSIIIIAVKRKK